VPRAGDGQVALAGASLLRLQRQHGNRYVQRVVSRARRATDGQQRANAKTSQNNDGGAERAADEISGPVRAAIQARRGHGQPLDPATSTRAARALGADLRRVRIHADTTADQLSRALNADAFTTGTDIFFRSGQYQPATSAGQHLLAHELSHVRQQQQTTPPPSARLRLAPATDAAEHAADQAATRITHGTPAGGPATGGHAAGPAIQRKVFIGKKELDQLPPAGDAGQGDRSVQSMINDHRSRYFKSEQELYDYAARRTETIGYVDKLKAWVRLNESELLVLGEKHGKQNPTLPDVADAVGTDRWMYEQYSDLPLWLFTEHDKLPAVTRGRARVWGDLAQKRREGSGHESETFAAKLWRGLAGFKLGDDPDWELKIISNPEWDLLESAIFAGAVAKDYMPLVHQAYLAHRKALEPALSLGFDQRTDWPRRAPWPAIKNGVAALHKALAYTVQDTMEAHPLHKPFSKGWRPAKKDYPDELMLASDRARDLSMYQSILRAANERYLLYGFGKMHGERLQELLNQQGARRKIKYREITEFKDQQRKRYPQ
jgi:hypothetical protein